MVFFSLVQDVCMADSLHQDWKGESEHILECHLNLLPEVSASGSANAGRKLQAFLSDTCLAELQRYWTGDCRLPDMYHTEREWGSKIKSLIVFSPIVLESLKDTPLTQLMIR